MQYNKDFAHIRGFGGHIKMLTEKKAREEYLVGVWEKCWVSVYFCMNANINLMYVCMYISPKVSIIQTLLKGFNVLRMPPKI